MKGKRITMSIVLAALMLVSLFAVVSSAASVSGTVMAGTGPAATSWTKDGYFDIFAVYANGALWNTSVMPSGGGVWNSLGGICTSSPAATSRNDGG